MFLKEVRAKKIKDSRGEPTIEVQIGKVKASAPSGKSKGKYETQPYHESLNLNINFLNNCKFNLKINSFNDLEKVEKFIKQKLKIKDVKKFGANPLVALEIAILKSLAKEKKKQLWQIINENAKKLPVPVGNAVGGGLHAHNFHHPIFQEFLLIPHEKSFVKNYKMMKKVYDKIEKISKSKEKSDEGAWQTPLNDEQIFQFLSAFKKVSFGTDVAASSFYKDSLYCYKNKTLDKIFQIFYINSLIKKFNLFYIEDPLEENDFEGFPSIIRSPHNLVVGDDLTATQISRLKKAIKLKSINAMIIKPNQNGSLLELAEIFKICKKHNIKTILSHRSGETMDDALADLAFGFGADYIKCGIATRWREVKLKRLCEIEKYIVSIK